MMRWTHSILRIGLIAAALAGSAIGGHAQTLASLPQASPAAASRGIANPIPAWAAFCTSSPAECDVNLAEAATIKLTPQAWQAIVSINTRVNGAIKPMTDQDHWGVADRWSIPNDGYGDCEDYQLLKRKLLVEAGLPRRALRMTVVIDDNGEGHAVLMVRTDRGDFVLDNKTSAILPWQQTGYVYVKREGQDSTAWVSLGGVTSPIATANR